MKILSVGTIEISITTEELNVLMLAVEATSLQGDGENNLLDEIHAALELAIEGKTS